MLKRILVALTGTDCGATAVRYAVELAERHEARLTGVTLADPRRIKNVGSVPIGAGRAAQDLREHRLTTAFTHMEESLHEFQTTCESLGIRSRVEMEQGDPFSRLLDISRYHDLVVFGVRGGLAFGHPSETQGLLGPLVANGIRPLLAVAEEYRPVRRAMIAYNGSRQAAKTMRRFAQLNAWPDVETEVVTFGRPSEDPQKLLEGAAAYLADHDFPTRTEHIPDPARRGILQHAAEREIDLIIMGYTTRGRLSKILLGENGQYVLRHTDRAVFLSQ